MAVQGVTARVLPGTDKTAPGAHAPGLVQAHDDAIAVLGTLHRLHHDARRVHGDEE